MDNLDIGADIDDVHGGDILVAEIEGEEDCEDIPMPTIESGMGLPPPADEDRQLSLHLITNSRRAAQLSRNSSRV